MNAKTKRFFVAAIAALMALCLVGCGTFSYNIKSYVNIGDYTDGSKVNVSQSLIDKMVEKAVEDLIDNYPGTNDVTEGTIEEDMTVYIYYEGTLVIFDGEVALTLVEGGIEGFKEAYEKAEVKDGVAEFTLKLAKDFVMPDFVTEAIKAKEEESKDDESKTEASEEEKDEKAARAASGEEDASESKSSADDKKETSEFADTEVTFTVKKTEGDAKVIALRWTIPGFEGGTYNEKTEEEAAKKEEEDKKSEEDEESEAETSEADETSKTTESEEEDSEKEEKKKGYALKIGSGSFIDGFEDGLKGLDVEEVLKEGTVTTLNLTFPNPYKNNTAYSGMGVDFDVTILSVTEEYDRDVTDEEQFEDLKKDYEKIYGEGSFDYKDIEAYKEARAKSEKQSAAMIAMMNASKMNRWPLSDYNEYLSNVRNQTYYYYYMMSLYGYFSRFNTEAELAKLLGMTTAEYEQDLADQAGRSLKQDLILYQIAKDQGLDKISNSEYKAYCQEEALENGYTDDDGKLDVDAFVEAMGGKAAVKKQMVLERGLDYLTEHITVVE